MASQLSALTRAQREKAAEMARRGRMISQISRELRLDYGDVWSYLDTVNAYSWVGAKRIITNRLNAMVRSTSNARRQELANEANDMVEYLYYTAKTLGSQIGRIKGIID